jgi:methyl acetate hydrolase
VSGSPVDVDLFPGSDLRWGLGGMINLQQGPNGRSAGTLSWGGIYNSYFWLDPARRLTGVIMIQILPFADARALALYDAFERGVYEVGA